MKHWENNNSNKTKQWKHWRVSGWPKPTGSKDSYIYVERHPGNQSEFSTLHIKCGDQTPLGHLLKM